MTCKKVYFGVPCGVPVTFEEAVAAHKHGAQACADCARLGIDPCDDCPEERCIAYPDQPLDCPFLAGSDKMALLR